MTHEVRYSDDDPYLRRVRDCALSFPGAEEKISFGRPVFFTRKIFGLYACLEKTDDGLVEHQHSVGFLPDDSERPALLADARFFVPAYWGPWGWLAVDLDDRTDWDEVRELLEDSYRLTAPKSWATRHQGPGRLS
ncbi:MAG: MmcQ/YjbR family DNA-binding protein [Nesterenkonia sp.]|nr:MmcQ/YjbR family DNA-binding protein [Nesterenkonia sp.]